MMCLLPLSVFGQVSLVSNTQFEETNMTAHRLRLDAGHEVVIEYWKEYWKDQFEVDMDRKDRNRSREIYLAEAVEVPSISNKQVDLYAKITTANPESTEVSLGIGFGYDVFAGPNRFTTEFTAAQNALADFESYFYRSYYGAQLDELRDTLKAAKKDQDKMQRDIEREEKRRQRWREKISDYETKIAESQSEQQELRSALNAQRRAVESLRQKSDRMSKTLRRLE